MRPWLADVVFCAPDYPERVAKQLVDKHARAVESMASDGACRARCHLHRFLPPSLLLLVLCPTTSAHHIRPLARRVPRPRVAAAAGCWLTVATLFFFFAGTFDPALGSKQSSGAKKAYKAICTTLAGECVPLTILYGILTGFRE